MAEPLAMKPLTGYDPNLYSPELQTKDYFRTFQEYAGQNFQRVVKNTSSAGAVTLYTVPEGYVLYVTAVHICIANDGTPAARGIISIGATDGSGQGETMLNVVTQNGADSANVSHSFNHLIRVNPGEFIQSKEISSNRSSIGFIGFLVRFKA